MSFQTVHMTIEIRVEKAPCECFLAHIRTIEKNTGEIFEALMDNHFPEEEVAFMVAHKAIKSRCMTLGLGSFEIKEIRPPRLELVHSVH